MKRSDVPVVDVLRAFRDYRAEMDASLAAYGASRRIPRVLQAMAIMEPDFPVPARPIARLPFPYKVVLARVMQLNDQGLLDYGVSPDVGWLTDAGRARLAELEAGG